MRWKLIFFSFVWCSMNNTSKYVGDYKYHVKSYVIGSPWCYENSGIIPCADWEGQIRLPMVSDV